MNLNQWPDYQDDGTLNTLRNKEQVGGTLS